VLSRPAKSAFASSSREICASISAMMSFVFMDPLASRIYELPRSAGAGRRPKRLLANSIPMGAL
jgi:hypothetical protein